MAKMPSWQSKGIFDPRVEREYKEIKGQDILASEANSLVSAGSIVVSAGSASFLLLSDISDLKNKFYLRIDTGSWSGSKDSQSVGTGAPQGEGTGSYEVLWSEALVVVQTIPSFQMELSGYGARATGMQILELDRIWNFYGRNWRLSGQILRENFRKVSDDRNMEINRQPRFSSDVILHSKEAKCSCNRGHSVLFCRICDTSECTARVMPLALGALGRIPFIGFLLSSSQIVCFRDILFLERLLVVSGDVICLPLVIRLSLRIGA
ncbi:hypothetical protein Tco_0497802 [Tanacetum coccineum]